MKHAVADRAKRYEVGEHVAAALGTRKKVVGRDRIAPAAGQTFLRERVELREHRAVAYPCGGLWVRGALGWGAQDWPSGIPRIHRPLRQRGRSARLTLALVRLNVLPTRQRPARYRQYPVNDVLGKRSGRCRNRTRLLSGYSRACSLYTKRPRLSGTPCLAVSSVRPAQRAPPLNRFLLVRSRTQG